jgi:branched-chain amino acid aminotransferase
MPCARVGNTVLGNNIMANDHPGPVSLRLKQLYWDKHAQGWHATPANYSDPDNPLGLKLAAE